MSMFDFGGAGSGTGYDFGGAASQLAGLWDTYQGAQTSNGINNQVQSGLAQNQQATGSQIQSLQDQIAQNRTQAQDMYGNASANVAQQNAGLQGNIDTMSGSLSGLSDPNSAYMQMARQAIERKDAAAGRRSQWGDREVQLAATLADYVGKYAPGMNNSITSARGQINSNNTGLANLYSTANAPADRNQLALAQMLQQQQSGIGAANTTGRQAANAATTANNGLITQGIGALGSLFGGGGSYSPISSFYGDQGSQSLGITGYGSGLSNLYGSGGAGSIYDNAGYGYGSMPAGDYFGGGGLGGTPTASYEDY